MRNQERLCPRPEPRATRLVLRLNGTERQQAVEYEEDEDTDDNQPTAGDFEYFDPATGAIADGPGQGILGLVKAEMHEDEEERRRYVKRCASCRSPAGRYPEPISTMHPGDDALAAVVAQDLLENLPKPHDRRYDAPMGGRNLLVFSDNRQDAAFFAPFFQRTSTEQAVRGAVFRVLQQEAAPMRLRGLAQETYRQLLRDGFEHYEGGDREPLGSTGTENKVLAMIAAEFCTEGLTRISLESLGLVKVGYHDQGVRKIIEAVQTAAPDLENEADGIVRFILSLMRALAGDQQSRRAAYPSGSGATICSDGLGGDMVEH